MASPGAERALFAGGAAALGAAAVASVALATNALPGSIAALVIPPACAGAIGAAAGFGRTAGWPEWRGRAVAAASCMATVAGLVTAGWFLARPSLAGLAATGVQTIGDSVFLLPGLLAWSAVRRPGAILLGLGLAASVVVLVARPPFPSLALLAAPVVAAPAEAWFLARGPARSARGRGLVGAGIILGFASVAATRLIHPGATGDWGALLVGRVLAGLLAGLIAARFASIAFTWPKRRGITRAPSPLSGSNADISPAKALP